MVSKSLTLLTLLMCVILAQTAVAKVTSKADESDSEDEDDSTSDGSEVEDSSDDEEDLYPSLSCLLFDDMGCNSECSVMGSAFGYKATGTCDDEDNICDCEITRKEDSLESLWNSKFDSKDILKEIKKDKEISQQVRDILFTPFQTAQEAKEELKSVLSANQYKKLKLNDDSKAATMKKNGKQDSVAIKKYVAEKLPKTLKTSDSKKLSTLKYKSLLLEALKNAKKESKEQENEAFDELVSDIRRTRNKSLAGTLAEYVKKNKLKESAEDKNDSSVADTIAAYVIDELVKKVDKKKPTSNKKSPGKKSATKPVKKTKSKKSEDDDDDDDADSSEVTLKKDRFVLKNFDKSAINRSGQINQNLSGKGYSVRYQKSWGGDINLVWIKGVDEARLQKSAGGNVNQNWKFGNVTIRISKSAGGDINENWNFGNTSYRYSKSAGGYVSSNWSGGKTNKKTLKTYQRFIDAWCRDNDFLFRGGYCVIYRSQP